MNRTTARLALTVAGAGILTGTATAAAHAATPYDDAATPGATQAGPTGAEGRTPNYVLQELPGIPLGNPVSSVFDVEAAAFRAFG